MADLFDPARFGDIELANRVVMAPMTRSRANANAVINASALKYYGSRASAGLIITEGINTSPMSKAFDRTPGLWTDEQIEGWKPVIDRVHQRGGRIVAQLWHGGRASARGLLGDQQPISPSGVNDDLDQLQVWALLSNGAYVRIAATSSRAMTIAEIEDAIAEFRRAAQNAVRSGFDGVEIHGANGYLIHEFLSPTTNRRTDKYGGSTEARAQFLREIVGAIAEVMPLSRVGLRLSPIRRLQQCPRPGSRRDLWPFDALVGRRGTRLPASRRHECLGGLARLRQNPSAFPQSLSRAACRECGYNTDTRGRDRRERRGRCGRIRPSFPGQSGPAGTHPKRRAL
jgi:N-ethylmaleimide reductase